MTLPESRTNLRRGRLGRGLFPALALAGVMAAITPGAGVAPAAAGTVADTAAGEAEGAESVLPIYGLPPIVAEVLQRGDPQAKTVIFKADLVFDEVDQQRINDSISVAKSLLPRIMDSVITGIQGKTFDKVTDLVFLNEVVVRCSNAVLKPYGVVVKSLRLKDLSKP